MKPIEDIKDDVRVFNVILDTKTELMCLVKLKDCGTCSMVLGTNENGMEHVSIAPRHQYRIPSWDDMAELKDLCFEDEEEVYQIHPPKSRYVNIKENCLHLWKPANGRTLDELKEQTNET